MTTPAPDRPAPILTPDLHEFWAEQLRRLTREEARRVLVQLARRYGKRAAQHLRQAVAR